MDSNTKALFIEEEALYKMMEEMANAPKEEMGKRQPGEPSTYAGECSWQKEK